LSAVLSAEALPKEEALGVGGSKIRPIRAIRG
jgi:hypothetical protein